MNVRALFSWTEIHSRLNRKDVGQLGRRDSSQPRRVLACPKGTRSSLTTLVYCGGSRVPHISFRTLKSRPSSRRMLQSFSRWAEDYFSLSFVLYRRDPSNSPGCAKHLGAAPACGLSNASIHRQVLAASRSKILAFLAQDLIGNNSTSMPGIESPQTFGFETLPPAGNKLRAALFQKDNPLITLALRQP